MSTQEWIMLIGVGVTAVVTIGPGLMAVHAKLAVVASQVAQLCDKVEKLSAAHEERLRMCIEHQARLDRYEDQLRDLIQRLEGLP